MLSNTTFILPLLFLALFISSSAVEAASRRGHRVGATKHVTAHKVTKANSSKHATTKTNTQKTALNNAKNTTTSSSSSSTKCPSGYTYQTFAENFRSFDASKWNVEVGPRSAFSYGSNGLVMKLSKGQRADGLPNVVLGTKKTWLPGSRFDILMKPSHASGIVSPAIFKGDGATDEVDLEFVGGDADSVQTVLWKQGNRIEYGLDPVPGLHPQQGFHTYTMDWQSNVVTLSVDGKSVRQHNKPSSGEWPTQALNFKMGPWASDSGADWAGVIDWKANPNPTMEVKSLKITGCAR